MAALDEIERWGREFDEARRLDSLSRKRQALLAIAKQLRVRHDPKTGTAALERNIGRKLAEVHSSGSAGRRATAAALPTESKRRRMAPPAAAVAAAARVRPLETLPTVVLGEVTAWLDNADVARATSAFVRPVLAAALRDREKVCRAALRCGARSMEVVRDTRLYRALDERCRAELWRSLALVLARGVALWSPDRARTVATANTPEQLRQLPSYHRFGQAVGSHVLSGAADIPINLPDLAASSAADAFVPLPAGAASAAGEVGLGVAVTRSGVLVEVASGLTFGDLRAIGNDPAVRAAIQRGYTYVESLEGPHEEKAIGDAEADVLHDLAELDPEWRSTVDFLWPRAQIERGGMLDMRPNVCSGGGDDEQFVWCGYTPAVRAAVLDGFAVRLATLHSARGAGKAVRHYIPSGSARAAQALLMLLAELRRISPRGVYPAFACLPASRRSARPIVLKITVSWEVGIGGFGAVDMGAVAPLVALLHDRALVPRERVLEWLELGTRTFPDTEVKDPTWRGRRAFTTVYDTTWRGGRFFVASADPPPLIPLKGCAGSEPYRVPHTYLSAIFHFAGLPRAEGRRLVVSEDGAVAIDPAYETA